MLIKTVFAGFGGQGVLSMGLNLAQAAMMEGKHVTYLPSYGAEVRGGAANCTVAISTEDIASPVASSPEFLVVMSQPSLERFQNQVESGGVLFFNSSLVTANTPRGDIELLPVPATRLAEEIGNPRAANMIMLGVFIKKTNLVSMDTIFETLKETFKTKTKLIAANKKALMAGYDFPLPKMPGDAPLRTSQG
ncbi:MAG: 2-oxoacid:acceptor oxidoreductase family protein [Dehalococcoidia bacterium]|nr:2-oxoacid:acceptor oxidoreductase family protein [Dehalococcoidia bacterium]